MQNAAFAALGLDWAYVPLPTPPERLEEAVTGLAALGFVGANVTTPHKLRDRAALRDRCDLGEHASSYVKGGSRVGRRTRRFSRASQPRAAVIIGDGGAATAFADALPSARRYSRRADWPPDVARCRSRRQRDLRSARRCSSSSVLVRRWSTSRTRRLRPLLPRAVRAPRSSEAWRFWSPRERRRSSSGPACPPRRRDASAVP